MSNSVYLLTPAFLPRRGGQETLVNRIGNQLGQKHDVLVATTTPFQPKTGNVETIQNYTIVRIPTIGAKGMNIVTGQFFMIPYLSSRIRKRAPDVFHLFEPFNLGAAALTLKKIYKIPLLLTVIGVNTYDPYMMNYWRFRKCIKFVMNHADAITASTTELAERARDQGCTKDIELVPHCVDTDRFHPEKSNAHSLRQKFSFSPSDPIVVAIQRLDPRKRTEMLIRAVPHVLKEVPDARFIIGGKGPDKPKLEQLVTKLDLEKSVKLIGFIPDDELPYYYASADLFAFHTLYEGFGIVVIEAMASGTPIVTTNVGGLEEIVVDNGAGTVVPPNKPKRMAHEIITLLHDDKVRRRCALSARKAAEDIYSIENVTSKYVSIYKRLAPYLDW